MVELVYPAKAEDQIEARRKKAVDKDDGRHVHIEAGERRRDEGE